jgi:hypothetical protein
MPIDFNVQVRGGIPAAYDYDWNGDGTFEESAPFPISHTYASPGTYTPKLRLRLGSSSVALSHPYSIRTFNPTGFLVAPSGVVATNTGTVPPATTDPPGTPLRIAYNLAPTPTPGSLGYAVFVNQGSGYLFAGLLQANRGTATDRLLLPPPVPGVVRFVYVRPFTASSYGTSSLPFRLP